MIVFDKSRRFLRVVAKTQNISRQPKGVTYGRFKKDQLDVEGMSDFAGGVSPETLRECTRGKPSGYG